MGAGMNDLYYLIKIKMNKLVLIVLSTFFLSCRGSDSSDIDYISDKNNKTSRNILLDQKTVVKEAKKYVEIYLRGADIYFSGVDDMMGNNIKAEFDQDSNQWFVFFTDGIQNLHVRMDAKLKRGNVKSDNGRFLGMQRAETQFQAPEDEQDPTILFSLTDFKSAVHRTFPDK